MATLKRCDRCGEIAPGASLGTDWSVVTVQVANVRDPRTTTKELCDSCTRHIINELKPPPETR